MSNISDQSNNKSWGHFSLYIGGDQHEATQFWLAMLGVIMGKAITLYQYITHLAQGYISHPTLFLMGVQDQQQQLEYTDAIHWYSRRKIELLPRGALDFYLYIIVEIDP